MSKNILRIGFSVLIAALALWLAVKYLFPIALPFLLGLYLALAAEPVVRLLKEKLHFPGWIASALSVSMVFLLTGMALVLIFGALMRQLTRLQDVLPQLEAAAAQALALLRQWLLSLAGRLPDGLQNALTQMVDASFSGGGEFAQRLLQALPGLVTKLAGQLSSGLFGLITGIISGYMLSGRLTHIREYLQKTLPDAWRSNYLPAIRGVRRGLGGWLLAQLKLAAVTFALLLVGLWLLRIPNSLTLSGLITLVDAFPILGVGTVLLPWALVCILQKNFVQGLGLLGLYGGIWLIRSILEPKLVGKGLGLDPLLTLIAIYAGWRLLGITGMLLSPILTMAGVQAARALRR